VARDVALEGYEEHRPKRVRHRALSRVAPWEERLLQQAGARPASDDAANERQGAASSSLAEAATTKSHVPAQARVRQPVHARVVWPEDRLMWKYFRRNPDARKIPYALNSFKPPPVKEFALRQLQLMQQGAKEADAYNKAQNELGARIQAAIRCASRAAATSGTRAAPCMHERRARRVCAVTLAIP
jgi:hypothetical protein